MPKGMGVRKIQIGQVWKQDGSGDTYLVTKLYSEALNTMAILRKAGSETESPIRVRVERTEKGQILRGFSPAMDEDAF